MTYIIIVPTRPKIEKTKTLEKKEKHILEYLIIIIINVFCTYINRTILRSTIEKNTPRKEERHF